MTASAARPGDGGSHGYRIAGPKYDGRGKTLLKHFVTERDVAEIIGYLKPETKPAMLKIEMGIGWVPDGPGRLRSANPGEYAAEIERLEKENAELRQKLRELGYDER